MCRFSKVDFPGFCGHVKLTASRAQRKTNADEIEHTEGPPRVRVYQGKSGSIRCQDGLPDPGGYSQAGETCGKQWVVHLMRIKKIRALGGYRTRHRSESNPSELVPNVLRRNFDVTSPATLERVLAQAADAALVVDESGTILFASAQLCRVLKYAPGELDGA